VHADTPGHGQPDQTYRVADRGGPLPTPAGDGRLRFTPRRGHWTRAGRCPEDHRPHVIAGKRTRGNPGLGPRDGGLVPEFWPGADSLDAVGLFDPGRAVRIVRGPVPDPAGHPDRVDGCAA